MFFDIFLATVSFIAGAGVYHQMLKRSPDRLRAILAAASALENKARAKLGK